jgi:glycine cleavage system H protein
MSYPSNYRYTASHEWAHLEDGVVTVGITSHATESLGDVVHLELPAVGAIAQKGSAIAEIESVKAVSDIYAPVSGEVVAINDEVDGAPETVNQDPHGAGWLFKIRVADTSALDELLDADAYAVVADG